MPMKEEGKAGRLGTVHNCNAALKEPWQSQNKALVQKHLQRSPWQCPRPSTVCSVLKSVALSSNAVVPEVPQMEAVGHFTLFSSTASSFLTIWQHFSVPEYR